jgi:hypothetical protein
MAIKIILQDEHGNQIKKVELDTKLSPEDWEERLYQVGCKLISEICAFLLECMEESLFQSRPKDWLVVGFRNRTLVTRFGDVTFNRRLYMDSEGEYHFLLDEYMDWKPNQAATVSLTEALVRLSTEVPFRKVSETMENLLAGVLSKSAVHQMLGRISESAIESEKEEHQASFQEGKLPEPGEKKASVVYTEADGVWIHLQREKEGDKKHKHYELKSAIAYDGWERLGQKEERYRLTNKVVYCRSDDSIPLWDGALLKWHKNWDLSYTDLIVINGDGAKWIDKGADDLPDCVRQLDGFHLARACSRGWENGNDMYVAIRSGRVRQTLGELKEKEGKTARKNRDYVLRHIDDGMDWRKKIQGTPLADAIPVEARGLGCMESNEDKLFANRMKKRGMSWTIKGAQHMGKAIELAFNDDLRNWCGRKLPESRNFKPSFELFDQKCLGDTASLPALVGPHASRPWARVLRDLTQPNHLLN